MPLKLMFRENFSIMITSTEDALSQAAERCARAGKSLTEARRAVYQLLLSSDRSLGAYELIRRLSNHLEKQVAP
ncbi:MAG: hypothetical protein AAGF15_11420, partial [Pseudomonadota bacterium]